MKKSLIPILIGALCIIGCNKAQVEAGSSGNGDRGVVEQVPKGDPARLTVTLSGSKATGVSSNSGESESQVNNLQVFVFRGGLLEAYGSIDNSKKITVNCTTGERDIYALVNAPSFSTVDNKDALLAKVSDLKNNHLDSFEMIGSLTGVYVLAEYKATLDVSRLASRIVIKKITRDFTTEALRGNKFVIDSIYVINSAANTDYALTSTSYPTEWYNKTRYMKDSPITELTCDVVNAEVANGEAHDTPHYFYTYPNPTGYQGEKPMEDQNSDITRLVVAATVTYSNGVELVTYYPVNFPPLVNNKSYEIGNLKISKIGSDDPDKPIINAEAEFEINVLDWEVVDLGEIEL